MTQHFRMGFWRCDQCTDSPDRPNDFNRKDLFVQHVRRTAGAPFIVNSGFSSLTTRDEAVALLDADQADAVAVGRLAIANPDLAHRWERDTELNERHPELFYGTTAEGYTDYPTLAEVRAMA